MLFFVLRHPTCASCVAIMCSRMSNSIKHVWACPDQSSRRGHWFVIAIMLFLVLRHPTCVSILHECVVGCPILSSTYEHVPIYHSIVFDSTPSYTPCALTSHHRDRCSSGLKQLAKHHWHVTNTPCKAPQKAVEGATALFVCLYSSSWMIIVRDKKHGTCLRNGRGCAAWALI